MKKTTLILLTIALLLPRASWAQQLNFGTQENGDKLVFNYTFKDYDFRQQHLTFPLPKKQLKNDFSAIKPLKNNTLHDYMLKDITRYLDSLGDTRITYKIDRKKDSFNLRLTGQNIQQSDVDAIKKKVEKIKDQSTSRYLREHYLVKHPIQKNVLMPDYTRLVESNKYLLAPVTESINKRLQGSSLRDKVNYTLNFLQSIPYDSFENMEPPRGLGYVTPGTLFMMNKGDCESKTLAAASIFKTLSPNTDMIAVIIPKHVLLGLAVNKLSNEETLTFEGKEYVLSEPTGSRILPLGSIFPESNKMLHRKNYIVQKL